MLFDGSDSTITNYGLNKLYKNIKLVISQSDQKKTVNISDTEQKTITLNAILSNSQPQQGDLERLRAINNGISLQGTETYSPMLYNIFFSVSTTLRP